jgi:micrococcal nuclease
LDKEIVLKTLKDKTGKYGRYLGIVYLYENGDYVNINDWLIENGHAKKYRYI